MLLYTVLMVSTQVDRRVRNVIKKKMGGTKNNFYCGRTKQSLDNLAKRLKTSAYDYMCLATNVD